MATSNTTSSATGNNQGTAGQGEDSGAIGVGGPTSGQAGATPAHETLAETGGSGGAQLTHSHGEIDRDGKGPEGSANAVESEDSADSALQSGARGAQDTRPHQGGGTGTGIGSPESGANQSPDDLPPA